MIKAKGSRGSSGIIFLQTASEVWIKINPNKGMLPEMLEDTLIEGVSYSKGSHAVEIVGAIDSDQRKHLKGPLFIVSGSSLKLIRTSQVKGAIETNGPYLKQTSRKNGGGMWKFDRLTTAVMHNLSESEGSYVQNSEINRLQELLEEPEHNCFIF